MSDKAKLWPSHGRAPEARNRAAEEAVVGIRALKPLVLGGRTFTETERLRREAVALSALQTIARLMENQGAPTRPECED